LKRNGQICPEVAVSGQFFHGKSKIFVKLPKKSKFFVNLPGKIEMFWLNCLKKLKIFVKFALKIDFFLKLREEIEIFQRFAL